MTLGLEGRHLHWNAPGTYKHLNSFIELYWQKMSQSAASVTTEKRVEAGWVFLWIGILYISASGNS